MAVRLINWIAERTEPDHRQNVQDWNREVSVDRFRASFADWRFGWVDVPALIDGAEPGVRVSALRPGSATALDAWPDDA